VEVGFGVSLEDILGDPGFENWLVNRVLSRLADRGVRLPEYVECELKRTSDGVRLKLVKVAELKGGGYGEAGLFHEENYSPQEMLYLYEEYKAEKSKSVRVLG
jgi:hypothetical protein